MNSSDPYKTPETESLDAGDSVRYVGFWERVFAAVVDSIVTSLVMLPPMYVLFGPIIFGTDPNHRPGVWYTILSMVGPAAIVFFFWIKTASTPGKMLINSKIIDAVNGGKPSIRQWVIRYFGYLVSVIPVGIGLFSVGWDLRKQGWHDKMAKTLVIKNTD